MELESQPSYYHCWDAPKSSGKDLYLGEDNQTILLKREPSTYRNLQDPKWAQRLLHDSSETPSVAKFRGENVA